MSLLVGSRAPREIIIGITNRLNNCAIFLVYTQFTNVAARHRLETHGILEQDVENVYRVHVVQD